MPEISTMGTASQHANTSQTYCAINSCVLGSAIRAAINSNGSCCSLALQLCTLRTADTASKNGDRISAIRSIVLSLILARNSVGPTPLHQRAIICSPMDALPDTLMRRIRNIDFCSQELETLLPDRTQKIAGTTLDAFAAVAQDVVEHSSLRESDFCIFSSWIPAICPNNDRAYAISRPRWAIPLCGGDPAHWVLGWIDTSARECGIADSIPELESARWAIPLLKRCIEHLQGLLGMSAMDWKSMKTTVCSPEPSERQIDGWSCGLFTMIALQTFADGWRSPLLGQSTVESVRAGALHALRKVPARPARNSAAPHTPSARIAVSTPSTDTPMPEQPSDEGELREKKRVLSDVLSDAEDSEPPKKVQAGGQERRTCFGCRKWVKLNKTRKFEWGNWESHRQTCSHISGVKTFRMGRMVNGKITFTLKLVTSVGTSSHSRVPYYVADEPLHNADTHFSHREPLRKSGPASCSAVPASSWRDLHRVRAPDADTHLGRDFTYLAGLYRTAAIPVQAFPALHGEPVTEPVNAHPEAPEDGNIECEERKWTLKEQLALDHALACWARWTIDFGRRTVKSTKCEGTTMDKSGVCDACWKLAKKDAGFKKAIARKKKESKLPEDVQRHKYAQREKYAPGTLRAGEARTLRLTMADPVIFPLVQQLERGNIAGAFFSLYQRGREGGLAKYETFVNVCTVLEDQLTRADTGPGAKKGIRYSQDYLNFMTMMRSYGQQSSQQYSILTSQIGGPSPRTLQ
ncbi:hypothetical protein C8Q72DRAFT_944230 [Fomitopsis betulina]|nr:hypothetical protein C8Q72DRAFT_944230 [Fomitopsis betulina]